MIDPKPIKRAMAERDINKAQLAGRAGISRPTLDKILDAEEVMPRKLDAVLTVLGLTRADVLQKPEPANV